MSEDTRYVLYVDDSGTKEYAPEGVAYGDGNTRYFVFGGPFLSFLEASKLSADIRALKLEVFRTETVEIKSNWLRFEPERERRYLKRFGLHPADLEAFVQRYYSLILGADLELIACVVDKEHMRHRYGARAWYPPAAAFELLLQRAQSALNDRGLRESHTFSVVVDDMMGKTPKGRDYRENLRHHHKQLKQTGSRLWPGLTFPCLDRLVFVDSKKSHLTQVADVVSYNVYRQFREHGEEWEMQGLQSLPTYDWFRRIAAKFRKGPDDRIQGFGVGKIPLLQRVQWKIPKKQKLCL